MDVCVHYVLGVFSPPGCSVKLEIFISIVVVKHKPFEETRDVSLNEDVWSASTAHLQ